MSLIARHLEASGIPTLCLATARDIIAAGSPPRAVFVDHPLGCPFGHPGAPGEHDTIARAALACFESIRRPGEIVPIDGFWSDDESWKARVTDEAAGDQRQPRDEMPRYQSEADRIAAEGG